MKLSTQQAMQTLREHKNPATRSATLKLILDTADIAHFDSVEYRDHYHLTYEDIELKIRKDLSAEAFVGGRLVASV